MKSRLFVGGVVVGTLGVLACDPSTAPENPLVSLQATTPSLTVGTVRQALPSNPTVLVTDRHGAPVSGAPVWFQVDEGGGSVELATDTTASDGLASSGAWTLGAQAGKQVLRAWTRTSGVPFVAFARVGAPAALRLAGGEGQREEAGSELPVSLRVQVTDGLNLLPEVGVNFTVMSGGGSVSVADLSITDDLGYAEGVWTLGPDAGEQHVRVEAGTVEAVFTAFASCGVGGDPCGAGTVPSPGRIAFASSRDGNSEIYSVNPDGTDVRRLTHAQGDDRSPAWSPDGTRIAFVGDRTGTYQVYTMKADGSEVLQRTWSARDIWDASWSPDGTRIVYAAPEGGTNLWVLDVASDEEPYPLMAALNSEAQPSWSPDGARIAFASDASVFDFEMDIWLVNADGTDPIALTPGPHYDFGYENPSWSPDGLRLSLTVIPYWAFFRTDEAQIAVISADGSGFTMLADATLSTRSSWSSDGTRIAFTTGSSTASNISWIEVDGDRGGILVEDGYDPAWGP